MWFIKHSLPSKTNLDIINVCVVLFTWKFMFYITFDYHQIPLDNHLMQNTTTTIGPCQQLNLFNGKYFITTTADDVYEWLWQMCYFMSYRSFVEEGVHMTYLRYTCWIEYLFTFFSFSPQARLKWHKLLKLFTVKDNEPVISQSKREWLLMSWPQNGSRH